MRNFIRGFGYALRGIWQAIRTERNVRFHLCAGAYVLCFARFYPLSRAEWLLLIALVAGVLALELVNSAIERTVDKASPERSELAKLAKDMAAGGVLVFSLGAAVCGVWLFWDTAVFIQIGAWFWARPLWLALLAVSLAASLCFVFIPGKGKRKQP